MADWSMTVEVAGEGDGAVSFRAVHADDARPHGVTDPAAGVVTAGPHGRVAGGGTPVGGDRVDALAAALTALLDRVGRAGPPARLGVVVDGDADRRDFVELDEAAALAGLPAPTWVPEPIAVAGHRLAARLEPGDAAVVLDARGTTLTAWPLERTETGVAVTARGPVAVTDRIDELLVGVVRATGRAAVGDGPSGRGDGVGDEVRGPAGTRRADAERRREVRRARRRLAVAGGVDGAGVDGADADETDLDGADADETDVDRAGVNGAPHGTHPGQDVADDGTVLDVAVFEQAVTSAVGDVMDALAGDRRVAVEVVADGPTCLARAICDLIGAQPVVPASSDAAVLGAAGLALGIPDDEDLPADHDLTDEALVDQDGTDEDRTEAQPTREDRTDVQPVHEDRTDVQPVHEDPRDEDEPDEENADEDRADGQRTGRDPVARGRDAPHDDAGPEPDESPTSEDVFGGPSPAWTPPSGDGRDGDDRGHPAAADSGAGAGGVRSWAVGSLAVSIVMIAATAALVLTGGSTTETSSPVVGAGTVAPA